MAVGARLIVAEQRVVHVDGAVLRASRYRIRRDKWLVQLGRTNEACGATADLVIHDVRQKGGIGTTGKTLYFFHLRVEVRVYAFYVEVHDVVAVNRRKVTLALIVISNARVALEVVGDKASDRVHPDRHDVIAPGGTAIGGNVEE